MQGLTPMVPESSQDPPEQLLFCIENVFQEDFVEKVTVGDLFATARGIYYISYCTQKFQFLRNNAIELSNSLNPQFHMGGTIDISQLKLSLLSFYNLLSGDVSETEEEQINEMLRKAATERTQQFGLTIEERVNENRGSIFVSRDTITSLDASAIGNRIELAHRGGYSILCTIIQKGYQRDSKLYKYYWSSSRNSWD